MKSQDNVKEPSNMRQKENTHKQKKETKKSEIEKENSLVYTIFGITLIIYFILIINIMDGVGDGILLLFIMIVNFIITTTCIVSLIFINKKYKDKFKEVKDYDYYRSLDIKDISAVASGILTKKVKIDINTVITAIYELSEKNIIEIKYKDKKNRLLLKEHDKNKINKLLPYEQSIIKFVFDSPNDTDYYCLEDILKEIEEDATKRYIVKEIEKEIEKYINKKYYNICEEYTMNQEKNFFAKLSILLTIIIAIFSALPTLACLVTIRFSNLFINLFYIEYIINFIVVVYYCKLKFVNSKYHDEVKKIYGLYAYMSDYSLLKSQELKFYQLYNKYYVYAMGLGLADKFEKEFNQPVLDNDVRTALKFYMQNKEEL